MLTTVEIFCSSKTMATLRNKRKLAAMASEIQEYPRNNRSQNSADPGITDDYIAQVSEEIEGRVTKKLSQELSKTGCTVQVRRISPLNPQRRTFSGATLGTFWNTDVE